MIAATLKFNYSALLMSEIKLWDKNRNAYGNFSIMIDTGASVTTISNDVLYLAGYDITSGNRKRITTASGIEYVREVVVDKIKMENYEINNVLVYAHTFPQESFASGVLGLNVLSMFDVNLLFSKNLIEFTLKP